MTSAQYLLESESNLAEIMRSMIGQTGVRGPQGMEGMDMRSGAGVRDTGAGAKGADMRGMPGMDLTKPRN